MIVRLVQYRRFVMRTVLAAALTFVFLQPGIAQTQDSTAPEKPAAATDSAKSSKPPSDADSAAEASKQASNPLASVWLMQIQQNNNWVEMPTNKDTRVQSNLQFQPLMPVKLADNWTLITRPVIQIAVLHLSDSNEFAHRAEQMADRTRRRGRLPGQELHNLRVSAAVVLGRRHCWRRAALRAQCRLAPW